MLLTTRQHWGEEGATYENPKLLPNETEYYHVSTKEAQRHFSITDHQSVAPVHS